MGRREGRKTGGPEGRKAEGRTEGGSPEMVSGVAARPGAKRSG